MKFSFRRALWAFPLAATLILCGNLAAAPQSERGLEKGRGHNSEQQDYSTNANYQQGWRDGQGDRASNRPHQYRERSDRRNNDAVQNRNYEAGYDAGFRDANNGGNNQRYDPRYGQNGQYGRNGQYGNGQYGNGQYGNGQYGRNGYGNNAAAQNGYNDGLFDGQKDVRTGHSNRPTQGDWYKSATRGYNNQGDREGYKAAYRQAYVQAYQRGYSGR